MNKSEEIKDLATALSKAQSKIIGAVKDATNPFYKADYSDLASVWSAIREPLTANGLSIVQAPSVTDKGQVLETILLHNSGQWISSTIEVKPLKDDPQGRGSALTYARRYALASMLSVPSIDDDGEAAQGRTEKKETPESEQVDFPAFDSLSADKRGGKETAPTSGGQISEKQISRLWAIANKNKWTTEEVLGFMARTYKIPGVKELTRANYDHLCAYLDQPR